MLVIYSSAGIPSAIPISTIVLNLVPRAVALLAGASVHPESAPTGVTSAIVKDLARVRRPSATKVPATKEPIGKIDAEHWLTTAKRAPIDGGGLLAPLYVVIHYTEGFNADSSLSGGKRRATAFWLTS